ncbi:MAG TPA: glycoside hydrolase family 57 protein [Nitrospiraceae bacterium]|nr:glycoside hydrolase family 57 protein [Nitrospiraceae bacterium]
MKTAHIGFLWHMHQPYYTDPVARTASMPWVRFHAIKAYFDMAFLIERFPSVRATFNFTPSLLLQLQELSSRSVVDLFFEHAQKPAAELTPAERAFIIRHFFSVNWATMVRPYPRYHELLVKRGVDVRGHDLDRLARQFTTQELLDLQVWHNLAWFGYGAVARYPRLHALRQKDREFTEEDKQQVLAIQHHIIDEIIPFYRRLAATGQIELTTTPFYHPIMPLVIDTDFGRRPRPETPLPSRFQAPDDAEQHLRSAVALHAELFGHPPQGLWPSEGSVCPEMVPMLKRSGLQWMATDEGVLARSLGDWHRERALYQPYWVGAPGEDVQIVFRDREISDAFGFVYSKSTPESAVEDVLRRLGDIVHHAPGNHLLIPIILDGENPWEHYYDGGERFLTGLYTHFSKGVLNGEQARVSTETIGRSLETHPAAARLGHLHTGSWISTDFHIWIGHHEDNRAWNLLRETRSRLVDLSAGLPPDRAHGAWQELYAAEGSDWFWWYGDDFQTDFKAEFDRLFRTHLRNVFIRAGAAIPEFLNEPIIGIADGDAQQARLPVRLLTPTIDGLVSSFFEWRGAGSIDPSPPLGAMWKSSRLFSFIGFGYSLEALFLRLDPAEEGAGTASGKEVEVHLVTSDVRHKAIFAVSNSGTSEFVLFSAPHESAYTEVGRFQTLARQKIIELSIPFKDLNLHAGQTFKLHLTIRDHDLEVERYPRHQPVTLTVPDQNFDAVMWRV